MWSNTGKRKRRYTMFACENGTYSLLYPIHCFAAYSLYKRSTTPTCSNSTQYTPPPSSSVISTARAFRFIVTLNSEYRINFFFFFSFSTFFSLSLSQTMSFDHNSCTRPNNRNKYAKSHLECHVFRLTFIFMTFEDFQHTDIHKYTAADGRHHQHTYTALIFPRQRIWNRIRVFGTIGEHVQR